MKNRMAIIAAPLALGAICSVALAIWLATARAPDIQKRVPGQTGEVAGLERVTVTGEKNTGTLIVGEGEPVEDAGLWPEFRGSDGTNIARDAKGLAREWGDGEPKKLWEITVGEGHAGPTVHNGRVYLVDYDREKEEDAIRCLSPEDGSEIWRYTYSVKIKRNHGMSRTVPAVNDDYLVSIGPKCDVRCLNAKTGELVWKMDLVEQFGTTVPPWYAGQCPIIEGDRVILAPGGDPLMMAVELATGEIVWRTQNPGNWGMTHSSIVGMDYNGSRQYVYCTTRGVVGVAAEDGELLWTKPDWKIAIANVPTPVVVGDDRIFFSGGYKSGCVMVRLKGEGTEIETEEVFRLDFKVFGAEQQTPILYKGHIYGVIPSGELACLDLEGNRLWTSGRATRFGLGPYMLADGLIFVLHDQKCTLHVAEATPEEYRELASAQVLEGHDAWGPMAMANGRLLLRSLTKMVCLQVP